MAKLSKSILKEIVKECIVEIFAESFFDKATGDSIINESINNRNSEKSQRSVKPRRPNLNQNTRSRASHLDNISFGADNSKSQETINEQTHNSINRLTNDPIMSEIFRDTAKSTMREQIGADSSKRMSVKSGGDAAALKAYNSDPTELFAESAGKWAQLAFADPINK